MAVLKIAAFRMLVKISPFKWLNAHKGELNTETKNILRFQIAMAPLPHGRGTF